MQCVHICIFPDSAHQPRKLHNCLVRSSILQAAAVELRGADFDWDNWAGLPPDQLAARRAATAALLRDEVRPSLFRRVWGRLTSRFSNPEKDCKPTKGGGASCMLNGKKNYNASGCLQEALRLLMLLNCFAILQQNCCWIPTGF